MPTHNAIHSRVAGPNTPILGPADAVDVVRRSLVPPNATATVVCFLEADLTVRSAIVVNGAAPDGDPGALIGAVHEILLGGDVRTALVAVVAPHTALPHEFTRWTGAAAAWASEGLEILDVLLVADDRFVSWAECIAARSGSTLPFRYRE